MTDAFEYCKWVITNDRARNARMFGWLTQKRQEAGI